MKFLIQELIKPLLLYYSKENIITKLQKLYSFPRNLRAGNKSPTLFLKKPLCTSDISPAYKIFIERPVEYQRLSGWHFPGKIIVESQKNRISGSCKVCILAEHEIHWLSNAPKKRKQHGHDSSYECAQCMVTLCIDSCFRFYHQHKDYITKYKSWKGQNSNNWLCSNIHAWCKIAASYNFIYIYS